MTSSLVQPGWKVYEENGGSPPRHVGEVQSVFYKPTSGQPVLNSVLCTHYMRVGMLFHPVILYRTRRGEWKNALRRHALYELEEA